MRLEYPSAEDTHGAVKFGPLFLRDAYTPSVCCFFTLLFVEFSRGLPQLVFCKHHNPTTPPEETRMRSSIVCAIFVFCSSLGIAQQTIAMPCNKTDVFIGSPAGSNTDLLGRQVIQKLSEQTGETFVITNRPGATGIIANDTVAKARPNGCTLLVAPWSSTTVMPHMRQTLPYDPLNDLVPVIQIAKFGYVLVSHPSVPANSIGDLIRLGKKNPVSLVFGSTGIGSGYHLAAELFSSMANVQILHVPYGGGNTPVLKDILGGHIDLMFAGAVVVQPFVEVGKLRIIAVTGLTRNALFPHIPTIDESGLPGYEVTGWIGIFVPKGTPSSVVESLNRRIGTVFNAPEMRALWKNQDVEFSPNTPMEFATIFRDSYDRNGKLIRKIGIKPE